MTRVLSGQLSVDVATLTHTGLSSARLRETTVSVVTASTPAAMHVDYPPPCQLGAGFDVPPYAEATTHPIVIPLSAVDCDTRPGTRPDTSSTTASTAPTTTPRRTSRSPRKSGASNRHGPRYVSLACGACKKAHLACDTTRPCRRCCSLDKGDQCRDEPVSGVGVSIQGFRLRDFIDWGLPVCWQMRRLRMQSQQAGREHSGKRQTGVGKMNLT